MSIEKSESLIFYEYLCQKIGSEEAVRMRRLISTVNNIGEPYDKTITSGSLGEGLHLKGSDIDIMIIESSFKVYESEKEVVLEDHNTPLIMNTEETQPCFAQLYLPKHWDIFYDCKNLFQKHHMGWVLSSELYKKYYISLFPSRLPIAKIHGPCLSDIYEQLDLAYCIQSDKWIFQAQSWQGVNCFAASETLQDYQNQAYKIPENVGFMQKIITTLSTFQCIGRLESLLYNFLHHSRTSLSKGLFALQLARACNFTPDAKYLYCSENKLQYSMYKYVLSHLLIGLHSDAVAGWIMLASFFYAYENYFASLTVIHYTLQKYTDEKIYTVPFNSMNLPGLRKTLNPIQKNVLNLMKKEKLYTILKALTIYPVNFFSNSSVIPQVLQLDLRSKLISYHPLSFANFLCFLCNYHLHDITSCNDYLQQLHHFYSIEENLMSTPTGYIQAAMIFGGIAYQLLGNNNMARQLFQVIAEYDEYNVTSAAIRLYRLT
ncbi:unnamed protein product [Mytilus coruscus]|uniref:Polymerase nucleotidyl transferase domain-containing protein n=1 Tax=Mytilus coruscus TaxID=42192 RepID=A0A6J8AIZ9_MYTCO|nr:unnamed protein product [Mytilus coruscus]